MVFKIRLPEPPRARYSAREIAAAGGVDVRVVMEALAAVGEFVDSPAKRIIEEPARRRVCQHLQLPYEAPALVAPPAWERRGQGSPPGPRKQKRRSRMRKFEIVVYPPKDSSVGLGARDGDVAPAWEEVSWQLTGFSEAERDAWLVYLRRGQAKLADELRRYGFVPEDLALVVDGWPVYKRLRSGEPLRDVKRLLERHRRAG